MRLTARHIRIAGHVWNRRRPERSTLRRAIAVAAAVGLTGAGLVAPSAPAGAATPVGPFIVDPDNREDVRQFYYRVHEASNDVPLVWTGDVATCTPGTVSADYLEATLTRINYLRAMAGVPSDITFTAENNATAQAAALIMAARNPTDPNAEVLSHDPPPDWACWTQQGRDGAATSNLFRGLTGPAAMDGFVLEGLNQNPNGPPVDDSLGHRRTLLNPQILTMGSGSVPNGPGATAAEAQLMVVDPSPVRHPTRDRFVAWPPRGFVPYQMVNAKWSFSLLGGDFSAATVSMRRNGTAVPTVIVSRTDFAGPGIVWGADGLTGDTRWPKPANDDQIVVTIGNVIINGVAETFTYTTTVFDPALADPARTPLVITGPDAPAVNEVTTFTANTIPNATGYQWRSTKFLPFALTDGAENGTVNFEGAAGDRSPIDTTGPASGTASFILTKNGGRFFDPTTLTLNRTLRAGADTRLTFTSRLSFMQSLAAHVDVSTDGGATWTAVFTEVGANAEDATYVDKQVSLAAFAGQQIRVRFSMEYLGGPMFNHAWFIDDISLIGAEEAFAPVIGEVTPTPTFTFTPTEAAIYEIAVRVQSFGSGFAEWSPGKRVVVTAPAGLAEALDAPGLVWASGGNASWSSQAAVTHDGVDAAQSGPMVDLQSTFASTTVTGPATLSFWWKVESEGNFDFLDVTVDDQPALPGISGAVDWEQKVIAVPAGTHTIRWTYSKDESVSTGRDAAWVDQLVIT